MSRAFGNHLMSLRKSIWLTHAARHSAVACLGALAACAVTLMMVSRVEALAIEITGGGADRLDRQRAWAEGELPLAGTPPLGKLQERLSAAGLREGVAVFVRIFKSESELELWMQKGRDFVLFATYPICQWSGVLGPKFYEGDNQSPEGFYTVGRRDLKWQTRHHRAFNVGFPNAFDKLHGRTGSNILVHGGCSTEGCFAMTNPVIDEVFKLANSAIATGQKDIQVHIFPFRMTATNLLQQSASPWIDFWINLKTGYDLFAETRQPPAIGICKNRYAYDRVPEFGATEPERDCSESAASDSAPSARNGVPAPMSVTPGTTGSVLTTGSVRATSAAAPTALGARHRLERPAPVKAAAPAAAAREPGSPLVRRAVRARARDIAPPQDGGPPPPLQAVPPQQMGT